MMRRVVVTGMGALTPVGMDVNSTWESMLEGRHGIKVIKSFESGDMGITCAAQIPNFDPTAHGISKKEARRMDLFTQYALVAADMAVADAGYQLGEDDPFRVGVLIGSGIGGFTTIHEQHTVFMERGPNKVSVFFIPQMISNMAAGMVSMKHGFKGANFSVVTACASGAHTIGEAFRAIKHGYLDCALAGGSEAAVERFSMAGFNNMGALTKATDPDRASIPFDKERSGFIMSEGAGILFLEDYEHAKNRGAKIYGEIIGYGATGDAYHMTSPDPEGTGAAKAMELAIHEGGIAEENVGYVNAHGTSTPLNDLYETRAIQKAFGEHANKLAISSTKSVTGHMLGAAGAVEAIATILALRDGIVPPTVGCKVPDPECPLDYVTEGKRLIPRLRYAISNSLGFGGHNATLCFKKFKEKQEEINE